MFKNKLAYLGFLGFLGFLGPFKVLGPISDNAAFMWVFFILFLYAKVIPDELFKLHVKNAATKAFFIGMIMTFVIFIFSSNITNPAFLRLILLFPFLTSVLIFFTMLEVYERREKKGLHNGIDFDH
ncbi:DUF3796 domain-containing protein [Cytobacillus sp. IB215665]|uniref:DUF3796 domain-containing protein n=1 Tax=Cytobacillus sp. IB215665 TaxID=3097357 RepID=UPI002A1280A6|nr:DUF3796 domain-containing protein [Cytobacillus sp. IB215665]MDX8367082.1 DUF3796 domain-containing protein [Cytobacillus sp. IB215665]